MELREVPCRWGRPRRGGLWVQGHPRGPAPGGRDRGSFLAPVSLRLAESDQVAGRVTKCALPRSVGHVHRLLKNIAASGLDALEGRIAILGAEVDAAQQTLGEHLLHYLAVGRGCVRVGKRWL